MAPLIEPKVELITPETGITLTEIVGKVNEFSRYLKEYCVLFDVDRFVGEFVRKSIIPTPNEKRWDANKKEAIVLIDGQGPPVIITTFGKHIKECLRDAEREITRDGITKAYINWEEMAVICGVDPDRELIMGLGKLSASGYLNLDKRRSNGAISSITQSALRVDAATSLYARGRSEQRGPGFTIFPDMWINPLPFMWALQGTIGSPEDSRDMWEAIDGTVGHIKKRPWGLPVENIGDIFSTLLTTKYRPNHLTINPLGNNLYDVVGANIKFMQEVLAKHGE